MSSQIVVPLGRADRIEEILPYLEEVAKPGMRVVFLMPFPVESGLYWRDYWITTESSRVALLEGKKMMDQTSWEGQRRLAEQRIFPARETLHKRGIDVGVDLYTGSLRRLIRDYAANRDVHMILVRAGIRYPLAQLLRRAMLLFGLPEPSGPAPVLFLHTNKATLVSTT